MPPYPHSFDAMCLKFVYALSLFYSIIADVFANAFSASVVVACAAAFASSVVAPYAIVASLALFPNNATIPAFCTRSSFAVRLASSTQCVAASSAAICSSASRFAFLPMCLCSSSSVACSTRCLVRCYAMSWVCFSLSGSCLSSIATTSRVSVARSLRLLPLELEAFNTGPSLIMSLLCLES